eukprot:12807131-Ditylum_brightwellii.AAC.1
MIQRVRNALSEEYGKERRVNLVHRLDRGASGCLIFTFADGDDNMDKGKGPTATLIKAMASPDATKTYIAIVQGNGTVHGKDLTQKGWFTISNFIKDENGNLKEKECSTEVRFIRGQSLPPLTVDKDATTTQAAHENYATIVLARPKTGRWHQIRQHLSGSDICHPILGDSSHGYSRTNRVWKKQRGMLKERVCLHLCHVELPPTEYCSEGVVASCPLPEDMRRMLSNFLPDVLEDTKAVLEDEGLGNVL